MERAEQGRGADGFQRPLPRRSRFQPQLTPGVDMTSDVKSWLMIFYVFIRFYTLYTCAIGRDGASKNDG